jgi:hypothetical protein
MEAFLTLHTLKDAYFKPHLHKTVTPQVSLAKLISGSCSSNTRSKLFATITYKQHGFVEGESRVKHGS